MENVNSRIVCKWWRKGQCNNTKCTYAHVGHQDKNSYSDTTSNKSTRVPACRNGVSCEWLKKGRCSFFHQRVGAQKPLNKNTRGQEPRGLEIRGHENRRQESRSQDRRQGGTRESNRTYNSFSVHPRDGLQVWPQM